MHEEQWPSYPEGDPRWIEELRRRSHANRNRIGELELELEIAERRIDELRRRLREKNAEMAQLISHTLIVVVLVVAAVVLTVSGNDGTPAWSAVAAYGVGAGVQKATQAKDAAK